MSDERLKQTWTVLEPSQAQRVRVEARVVAAWESRERSLFSEWLDVLRARPLLNGAWVVAAMAVLLFTTPVGGLLAAIPKLQAVQLTSRSTTIERERRVELLGAGTVVESQAATLGLGHELCLGQRCLALVSPAVDEAPGRLAHEGALRE